MLSIFNPSVLVPEVEEVLLRGRGLGLLKLLLVQSLSLIFFILKSGGNLTDQSRSSDTLFPEVDLILYLLLGLLGSIIQHVLHLLQVYLSVHHE